MALLSLPQIAPPVRSSDRLGRNAHRKDASAHGNILTVTGGGTAVSYVYDGLDQLVRENNQAAGKTWTYTYNAGGNITAKREYAYTTGALGTVLSTVNYGYGDSTWKDLLTSYNGQAITSTPSAT